MIKVEAIVVRERVETVMDAVEEQTGHVGVTVVEAVGHGRERGITHEYRGRIFESRFLPKAHLTFVVRDEIAEPSCARSPTPPVPGHENGDGICWSSPVFDVTHHRTGMRPRGGRGLHDDEGARRRRQHHLGRLCGRAGDVHAGRLRLPRSGPDADEERRPHRGQERAHPRAGVHRLLPGRLRHRVRRRRQRPRRRLGVRPFDRRARHGRQGAVLLVRGDPGVGRLPVRGRLLRRVAGDRVGRHGRADEAVGVLRLRRRLHAHLLARLPLDLEPGRLVVRVGHAGLRRLDGRPPAGSARRPRRGAAPRAANRQVRPRREAKRDPRPQHGLHHAGRDHPLVRLVRLQSRIDVERRFRRRRFLRLRRPEHEHRGRRRRARRGRDVMAGDQEARPLDDAQRRRGRARRDHRRMRVRRPLGGDRDRGRRRHDRRLRRPARGARRHRRPDRRNRGARHGGRLGHASHSASSRSRARRRSSRRARAVFSTGAASISWGSSCSVSPPSARSRSPRPSSSCS